MLIESSRSGLRRPGLADASVIGGLTAWLLPFVRRHRWPLLLICLPTLLTALYFYGFAADQYTSTASLLVRSEGGSQSISVMGQVLGAAGLQPASEDANAVADYIASHDAVRALQQRFDLTAIFRRTGADLLSRIKANPSEEDLTHFFRQHVSATLNGNTGLLKLEVRAFRPADAKEIADALVAQSEDLVNRLSARAQDDALRVAQGEVDRAQARMLDADGRMSKFRKEIGSLDPTKSSAMVMEVTGALEGQLAKAKAETASARLFLKPSSPRIVELQSREAGLQAQLNAQNARMAGGASKLVPAVADYDRLSTELEFARRDYAAAMAAYETARVEAVKQHVYVVSVVQPDLPQKSFYPLRGLNTLTVLVSLLVAYGIGWLILAGIREHAA